MADITSLFRASVKTVRTRNKALGLGKDGKTQIFPHTRQRSDFSQRTREVVSAISKLKEFLLKHQKDYINTASNFGSDVSSMTNAERDQIDSDAQEIIQTCSESIRLIKSDAAKQKVSEQVGHHREAVVGLLETYLKGVCKIYSEQRAIRVKRVVDKKRISRLKSEQHLAPSGDSQKPEEGANKAALEENSKDTEGADDLSPEEIEAFEQENRALLNEMNNLVDEVRQIEGKVVEITQLQEIFAEKVLQQNTDIDRIAETTVKSTENIKQGNEDIREAIKNNASLRVWILFFLVMCSFSLLFLDWYS